MKSRAVLQVMGVVLWIVFAVSCTRDSVDTNRVNKIPVVTASDPANLADETGTKIKISATFSEVMDASSINSNSFQVTQGATRVPGQISYLDKKATFTPSVALAILTDYTATLTTEIRSASGKFLGAEYIWSFTTCHPPEVISTTPPRDTTCVALNLPVSATFNHDNIIHASVNAQTFVLFSATGAVSGTVAFSGITAVFTPTVALLPGVLYTARLTTGIINDVDMNMEQEYSWSFTTFGPNCTTTGACPPGIDLKSAGGYGILAGTAITNVGFSVINDLNVGISPGFRSSVTGFPPAVILNGSLFAADDIAPPGTLVTQAKTDLTAAYLVAEAATSPTPVVISADLGGRTLGPGIYTASSSMLLQSGDLTLDGGQSACDSSSVWIFQAGSTLTTVGGGGGNVILIGGAQAKHVFWQVGSSATIGDGTSFKGTILALTTITLGAGATVEGRALARNGAVTLTSANTIIKP